MTNTRDYKPKPDLLKGRVILVTGATRGIGRVAALTFAAYGATVVLHGRDVSALEKVYDKIQEKGHPEPAAIPLDLDRAGTRDFDGLAYAIESRLGRLDGLLHNAAHFEKLSALELQTAEEWEKLANLRANVVIPGPVDSPSRAKTHPGELAASRRTPEKLMAAYLYLIGPDSRGVTGQIIAC